MKITPRLDDTVRNKNSNKFPEKPVKHEQC